VIIESLLDTDLYKFTMMQVVLHQFPGAMVEYRFKCRTQDVDLSLYAEEIKREIAYLCQLRFTRQELVYLRGFRFFKSDFIDFLRIFQLSQEYIEISTEPEFSLVIRGPWLHTIMFEVPILAIISEVYCRNHYLQPDYEAGKKKLLEKVALVQETPGDEFKFAEFGTRRRFSGYWQDQVVELLHNKLKANFSGTSNVYYAKKYDVKPIGTMAHEYMQACQALGPRLKDSQKFAFEIWAKEYRGDLGIALSDTYSIAAFLHDFDMYFCKLFDGARQDSGDPYEWGEKVIAHYHSMRVDPKTKILTFSDALSFTLAIQLFWHFKDRTHPVFGIGTKLTNDLGHKPIQIVIKMTECNGQPVAKVSDAPEKTMCKDPSYLQYLKQVFNII
jgi:nicotinate phosphoribosyltransferase